MKAMQEDKRQANQTAEKIYNVESIENFHQTIEKAVIYVSSGMNAVDSYSVDKLPDHEARLNGFITDSGKDRYLLNNYGNHDQLDPPPVALYILNLYFFTIVIGSNERFLILEQFNADGINEWSCPYTLHHITTKNTPSSFGEIRRIFAEELEGYSASFVREEDTLFQEMGISFRQLEKGRDYIEYVRRDTPGSEVCFLIREFFIHNIDTLAMDKIIGSKRFRYYPLSLFDEYKDMFHGVDDIQAIGNWCRVNNIPVTPECYYPIFKVWANKNIFLGLPVPARIQDIEKDRLISNTIPVRKSSFITEQGLLFMISLRYEEGVFADSAIERVFAQYGLRNYCMYSNTIVSAIQDSKEDPFPLLVSFIEDLYQEIVTDNEGAPFLMLISLLSCGYSYDVIDGYSTKRVGYYGKGLDQIITLHGQLTDYIMRMEKEGKVDYGLIIATSTYEFTDRFSYTYRPVSSLIYGDSWHATVSYRREERKETLWNKIAKIL